MLTRDPRAMVICRAGRKVPNTYSNHKTREKGSKQHRKYAECKRIKMGIMAKPFNIHNAAGSIFLGEEA